MSLDDSCLYCGRSLAPGVRTHLDHMDPQSKWGWDHPDNLLRVCKPCNLKKGDLLFHEWLDQLPPKRRAMARSVYIEKHCYPPEAFIPGPPELRFGYRTLPPPHPSVEDLARQLEEKKAQGALTQPEVFAAIRKAFEMQRASPAPPTEQLPDERGLYWACEYLTADDTPDEGWWFKERWFAYCEIPSDQSATDL